MLDWLMHRAAAAEEADTAPGPIAIIEAEEAVDQMAPDLPADPKSKQFELFNGSITTGNSATFEASREPERWTLYLVTATNTDQARASHGRTDPGTGPAVYVQYRHVVVLPGRGRWLTVYGVLLAGPTTVVAIASSHLPVEVAPA